MLTECIGVRKEFFYGKKEDERVPFRKYELPEQLLIGGYKL